MLGSVGMQILLLFTVLTLTVAGSGQWHCRSAGMQFVLLFTVLELIFAGAGQCMQILKLFAVLALTFAGSEQCRHVDVVSIYDTRAHFCWFWAI